MLQYFITLLIIFSAVAYTIYALVKTARSKNDSGTCSNCSCHTSHVKNISTKKIGAK
jgi:hypothetical protein